MRPPLSFLQLARVEVMAVNAGVSPGVVVVVGEAIGELLFTEGMVWKCESLANHH